MAIMVWSLNTLQGTYKDTADLKARFFEDRHAGAWRRDRPQDFWYVDTKTHAYINWKTIYHRIKALMDSER